VLLDRKRVKFWQKWVFLFMAIIMAGFLVMIPLSSRVAGCGGGGTSALEQLNKDVATYQAQVTQDPKNVDAQLNLAENYLLRANQQTEGSTAQQADWSAAALHYKKAAKLLSKDKTAAARLKHIDTLEQLVGVYIAQKDYQAATSVYGQITALKPNDSQSFFNMAAMAIKAGDNNTALLAFQKFLQLDPTSPDAASVRAWIKSVVSPSPSPSPSPSASASGSGQ